MKTLLVAFVALCGTLQAGQISVVLNFNVNLEYLYPSGEYNPLFTPEIITATAIFDDTPTSRVTDLHGIAIGFGVPFVLSPLTATLPYAPGSTTIDPSPGNSVALMTNYNFGPGDTGSYFQIAENESTKYANAQTWTYGFAIAFPGSAVIAPLSSPSTFSGGDLVTWLSQLQTNRTSIALTEYSNIFDASTGKYVGGTGYSGEGVITAVTSTPEPATPTLIAVGFAGLIVLLRRRARA